MQVSAKPQALLLNDCVCTRECTCMRRPSSACIFRTLKGVLCMLCLPFLYTEGCALYNMCACVCYFLYRRALYKCC